MVLLLEFLCRMNIFDLGVVFFQTVNINAKKLKSEWDYKCTNVRLSKVMVPTMIISHPHWGAAVFSIVYYKSAVAGNFDALIYS